MGILNVVTPACRQIPDRPQTLSLRGRAGLYMLEDMVDHLCRPFFKHEYH